LGWVKSPLGRVVSRRTEERAWVFKVSRVPLRPLFEALAGGGSVGEFVKRFPELQAEDIKNILRGVGLLVECQLHERSLTLGAIKWGAPKGHSAAVTAVEKSSYAAGRARLVSRAGL
jgi:hypothetical protein